MRKMILCAALALFSIVPVGAWGQSALEQLDAYGPFLAPADLLGEVAREQMENEGQDAEVLRSSIQISIDDAHRITYTDHQLFLLRTREAVEALQQVAAVYMPRTDELPEVRARVYTDGAFHEVGQLDLSETAAPDMPLPEFSDQRIVRAPLPSVKVSSIVEQQIVSRQHTASFDAGVVVQVPLAIHSSSGRMVVTVTVPRRAKVDVVGDAGTVNVAEVESERGSRRFLVTPARDYLYEYRSSEPEAFTTPTLVISTAPSWNRVARRYQEMVAPVAQAMDRERVEQLLGSVDGTPQEKVARALGYISDNVRYLSYDLGQTRLHPDPLDDILSRQYGDCKDQSTLLVAMLAAMGLEARVALLSTSTPVSPDHPGISAFDHAIVHLPKHDLWIDPTAPYASAARLPLTDQNRYALVVDPSTRGLVRTPLATPDQNRLTRRMEVTYADNDAAAVVETRSLTGNLLDAGIHEAQAYRDAFRQNFEQVATSWEGELADVTFDSSDNRFEMTYRVDNVQRWATQLSGIRIATDSSRALELMPIELKPDIEKWYRQLNVNGQMQPYEEFELPGIYIGYPHRYTLVEVHRAPPGFAWHGPPPELVIESPAAGYERTVSVAGTELIITTTVELRQSVAGDAVEESLEAYRRFSRNAKHTMSMLSVVHTLTEEGRELEALAAHRDFVKKYPDNPNHAMRMAQFLKDIGLNVPARDLLTRVAAEHPDRSDVQWLLGHLWELGDFSIAPQGPGADNRKALAHYRRFYELDDESPLAARLLGEHILNRYLIEEDQESLWQLAIDAFSRYRDLEGEGATELLAKALLAAERLEEMGALLDAPDGARRPSMLAVRALVNGVDDALSQARSGSKSEALLLEAARLLVQADQFDVAVKVLDSIRVPREHRQLEQMLRRSAGAHACEADHPDQLRLLNALIQKYILSASVDHLPVVSSSPHPVDVPSIRRFLDKERYLAGVREKKLMLDRFRCRPNFELETAGSFVRLETQDLGRAVASYFARAEDGAWVLLAIRPAEDFYAQMVRIALDSGDLQTASAWVRWSVDAVKQTESAWMDFDVPDRTLSEPELEFFSSFLGTSAAGVANAPDGDFPPSLTAGLKRVPDFMASDAMDDRVLDLRYYLGPAGEREALAQERFDRSEQMAEDWDQLIWHYNWTGDAAGFRQALEGFSRSEVRDAARIEAYEQTYLVIAGEYEAYAERLRRRLESGEATPNDVNNGVWRLLMEKEQIEAALQLAEKAQLATSNSYARRNTYAALAAANGLLSEAYSIAIESASNGRRIAAPADMAVIALIAHQAGYEEYGRDILTKANATPYRDLRILQQSWFGSESAR